MASAISSSVRSTSARGEAFAEAGSCERPTHCPNRGRCHSCRPRRSCAQPSAALPETRTLVGRDRARGQRLQRARGRHQSIRERDERGQRLVARAGPGIHEARGLEEGGGTGHARDGQRAEGRGGLLRGLASSPAERELDGLKPRVQLAAEQRERVPRREQELDADVDREPQRPAPPQPEHGLDHHLGAGRGDVGQNHDQGGRKAENRSDGADGEGTLQEEPDEEVAGEEADAKPWEFEGQLQGEEYRREANGEGRPSPESTR